MNRVKNVMALRVLFSNIDLEKNHWKYLQEKIERYVAPVDDFVCDTKDYEKFIYWQKTHEKYAAVWGTGKKIKKILLIAILLSDIKIDSNFFSGVESIIPFEKINDSPEWKWGLHPRLMNVLDDMWWSFQKFHLKDFILKTNIAII